MDPVQQPERFRLALDQTVRAALDRDRDLHAQLLQHALRQLGIRAEGVGEHGQRRARQPGKLLLRARVILRQRGDVVGLGFAAHLQHAAAAARSVDCGDLVHIIGMGRDRQDAARDPRARILEREVRRDRDIGVLVGRAADGDADHGDVGAKAVFFKQRRRQIQIALIAVVYADEQGLSRQLAVAVDKFDQIGIADGRIARVPQGAELTRKLGCRRAQGAGVRFVFGEGVVHEDRNVGGLRSRGAWDCDHGQQHAEPQQGGKRGDDPFSRRHGRLLAVL